MPYRQAGDLNIYVEERGSGEPVLYISGTGGDLRAKPNVLDGPLADSYRVIAYDQRGLGQTDKPSGPYTMAQYGDDAARLLDALAVDRAHVVGVSFGGMVAQHFALAHPDRINRLVLCCTSPGGSLPSYPFHALPDDIDAVERMLQLLGISDTRHEEAWQSANPDKVKRMVELTRASVIADHATPAFKQGYRSQVEARSHHDTLDRLGELAMPVLICAGRYDGIAPAANQHAMHERIRDARLEWYEGGHLFLIQDKKAWPDIISYLGQ